MGSKSRRKGAAGEREVVSVAVTAGFPSARRSAPLQAANGQTAPDVDGVPGLWLEVKRHRFVPVPRLALGLLGEEHPGSIAVLMSRSDDGPWLATLDGSEFLRLWRELLDLREDAFRWRQLAVNAIAPKEAACSMQR